jgi:hypothetical protein
VTEENLLARERDWPYRVALIRSWQPDSGRTLRVGQVGVLVRVEDGGVARVDFGRHGRHSIPVGATDLVERANRIRRGELAKTTPNFVAAIGPRLLDSGHSPLRPLDPAKLEGQGAFLCVFADPEGEDFASLVEGIAPLRRYDGVSTLLFPQGRHADIRVGKKLKALGWTVPFVFNHLAEPYSRTLLPEPAALPALLLQTSEGRVLFQSPWRPGVPAQLIRVLERAGRSLPG